MAKKKPAMWTTLVPVETVEEIHRQLFAGIGPGELATKVQSMSPPMFADRTAHTVTQWFNDYRKKSVLHEQTKALLEAAKFRGTSALRKRVDVVGEMEELVAINRARLAKGLNTEAGSPIPLDAVSKLALALGVTLERLAHLYLETGLIHRVPKQVNATLTTLMGGRPVFEFTEEESRRFSEARMLEHVAEVIDIEEGNDVGI